MGSGSAYRTGLRMHLYIALAARTRKLKEVFMMKRLIGLYTGRAITECERRCSLVLEKLSGVISIHLTLSDTRAMSRLVSIVPSSRSKGRSCPSMFLGHQGGPMTY